MLRSKGSWGSLPTEVHLEILEALRDDGCPVARFASVCREWQAVLEPKTFARLTITPSRVAAFGDIVGPSRRRFVRYIWLSIELQEYDCTQCQENVTEEWRDADIRIMEDAFRGLLLTLSTWEPRGKLLLDIGVYSPSDSKHYFKGVRYGPDAVPELDDHGVDLIQDPNHGWIDGRPVEVPQGSISRCFATTSKLRIECNIWNELPPIRAVTGVHVRRQSRRNWSQSFLTSLRLATMFPSLEEVYYEGWSTHYDPLLNFHALMLPPHPRRNRNCRRVVMFEDFSNYESPELRQVFNSPYLGPNYRVDPTVSTGIAKRSLKLEHLSVAFFAEAADFFEFQAPEPDWNWPNLVTIALTSRFIRPGKRHHNMNVLLRQAAAAAMKMPRLRTMEIWNGRKGMAGVFRYQVSEVSQRAAITWRASWGLQLEPITVSSWEAVAEKNAKGGLEIVNELLDQDSIQSLYHAITELKFVNQVVHPVSLWQMGQERRVQYVSG